MTAQPDIREINRQVIEEYRATGGRLSGPMDGSRVLLLTTVGARTGRPRTCPMMFLRDGDRFVVFASNDGAPRDPDWFRNLTADPEVTVEVGPDTIPAVAAVTAGPERARLWATVLEGFPFFAEHEARAGRQIPVVTLTPRV